MTEFKKGDKVKCISGDIIGCEGIIAKVRIRGYNIRLTKIGNETWQKNWVIGEIEDRDSFWKDCLELIEEINEKPTHIILWNVNFYIAYRKKDRDEKIKELVDNKEVDNNDITIFDIENESKVKCKIKYLFFS